MPKWMKTLLAAIAAALGKALEDKPAPPAPPEPTPPAPPPPAPEPPEPAPEGEPPLPPDGTFVWVPVSMRGTVAVVLPCYIDAVKAEIRYGKSNAKVELLSITPGRHNGDRQTVRGSKPGAAYGKRIQVVVVERDGREVTWKVADGSTKWYDRSGHAKR